MQRFNTDDTEENADNSLWEKAIVIFGKKQDIPFNRFAEIFFNAESIEKGIQGLMNEFELPKQEVIKYILSASVHYLPYVYHEYLEGCQILILRKQGFPTRQACEYVGVSVSTGRRCLIFAKMIPPNAVLPRLHRTHYQMLIGRYKSEWINYTEWLDLAAKHHWSASEMRLRIIAQQLDQQKSVPREDLVYFLSWVEQLKSGL